jgi:DinB family protein
LAKHAFYS